MTWWDNLFLTWQQLQGKFCYSHDVQTRTSSTEISYPHSSQMPFLECFETNGIPRCLRCNGFAEKMRQRPRHSRMRTFLEGKLYRDKLTRQLLVQLPINEYKIWNCRTPNNKTHFHRDIWVAETIRYPHKCGQDFRAINNSRCSGRASSPEWISEGTSVSPSWPLLITVSKYAKKTNKMIFLEYDLLSR